MEEDNHKELDECIDYIVRALRARDEEHRRLTDGLRGQLRLLEEEKSKLLGLSTENIKIVLDENDVPVWVRKE